MKEKNITGSLARPSVPMLKEELDYPIPLLKD